MISIHAPTRGATRPCDAQTIKCDFNPRSYKRSDMSNVFFMIGLFISIHAPTRGATSNGGNVS